MNTIKTRRKCDGKDLKNMLDGEFIVYFVCRYNDGALQLYAVGDSGCYDESAGGHRLVGDLRTDLLNGQAEDVEEREIVAYCR